MEKVELYLDAPTIERARRLAHEQGSTVEELLTQLIKQVDTIASSHDPVLGAFADEPDLLDQVVEEAMLARETHVLRKQNE